MLAIIQLDARVPAGLAGTLAAEAGLAIDLLTPFSDPLLPEPSNYSGIIILGGYMGVGDIREYPYLVEVKLFMKKAVLQEIPLLGICLGGQLLAEVLEAPVHSQSRCEHGVCALQVSDLGQTDPLLAGLGKEFFSFGWHNDSFDVPTGAVALASTEQCPGQAFRYGRAYGLQFHPEVTTEIVAKWSDKRDDSDYILEQFTSREPEIAHASRMLFRNYFAVCHLSEEV